MFAHAYLWGLEHGVGDAVGHDWSVALPSLRHKDKQDVGEPEERE